MADLSPHYEVEIRFRFGSTGDAYAALPFLHSCLQLEGTATDTYYGLQLFRSGKMLRISDVHTANEERHYLAWKGPDIGQYANIRQELSEDVTGGVVNSAILKELGGKSELGSAGQVAQELERLGHHAFMWNEGRNLKGHYEPLGIDVKLMTWSRLKWPLMVEIEKIASTEEEARQCEKDLQRLSRRFKLEDKLVSEEPPSQLYVTFFGGADASS